MKTKTMPVALRRYAPVAGGGLNEYADGEFYRVEDVQELLASITESRPQGDAPTVRGISDDQSLEEAAESAYWNFDARIGGIGPFKGVPQSTRDAFKAEYRKAVRDATAAHGVPDDPTEEMILAGMRVNWADEDVRGSVINMWYVMLNAAPSARQDGE